MKLRDTLSALVAFFRPEPDRLLTQPPIAPEEPWHAIATVPPVAPEPQDTVGDHSPIRDWLGAPLHVGDTLVYPSEGRGQGLQRTTTQMVLGEVTELHEDGGATVCVFKRSRTAPSRPFTRLSAVGVANATKLYDKADAA